MGEMGKGMIKLVKITVLDWGILSLIMLKMTVEHLEMRGLRIRKIGNKGWGIRKKMNEKDEYYLIFEEIKRGI